MPRIDFYILSTNDTETIACRILEKAYQQTLTVYVHCETEALAKKIDERLWTYKDASFIPHQLVNEIKDTVPPVFIGFGEQMPAHMADIVMNISPELPEFALQFERVIYVVPNDESWKQQARDYFKEFQAEGWEVNHFKI